ncbi:hypothetical protein [Embleya hyalina]|uniref:Uncharacterized protein n=1 Tax=Embleya hyalina TaxID=516124 RepID=A0A401YQK7_9ACTN|nr:hypothetical protein [Embleya hyalina]GCD96873.1 hypothetical protein EHYA_04560 [Embleya hyalina]
MRPRASASASPRRVARRLRPVAVGAVVLLLGVGATGCGDSGGGEFALPDQDAARGGETASWVPGDTPTAGPEPAASRPAAPTSAPSGREQPELPAVLFGLPKLPQDPDGDVARFVGRENTAHDPDLSGMRTAVYGTDARVADRFAFITIAGPGKSVPRVYLEEISGVEGEVRVTSPLPDGAFRCWNADATGLCAWADDTHFLAVGVKQKVASMDRLVREVASLRRAIYGP